MDDIDGLILEASLRASVGQGSLQLPWEQGVLGEICGADCGWLSRLPCDISVPPPPPLPIQQTQRPSESLKRKRVEVPAGVPLYVHSVLSVDEKSYSELRELDWTKALAIWMGLHRGSQLQSAVGEHVYDCLCRDDHKGGLECLRDACGIKSPKTVLKRGRDLKRFAEWCGSRRVPWWPFKEKDVLAYISASAGSAKSKLRGRDLLSAIRFFRFVFGAHFDIESVLTPLVAGRVRRIQASRKPKVQSQILSRLEVLHLEHLLLGELDTVDKYYLGCLLFALYARCRWSDMAAVESLEFDLMFRRSRVTGFVEARTREHKTGGREEKKSLYMPLVAPAVGLSLRSWAQEWQRVMQTLGIDYHVKPFGPICKAMDASGTFNSRPLGSKEASDLLVGYLGAKGAVVGEKITSHTLKATLLAWAARRGLPENDRVVLGHHSLRSDSLATYSRDLLGAATRTLCGLIAEVKLGAFDPDGTRSGWLLQQAGTAVGAGLDENQAFWAEAAGDDHEKEGAYIISESGSEAADEPWEDREADDGREETEHYAPVGDHGEDVSHGVFPSQSWGDAGHEPVGNHGEDASHGDFPSQSWGGAEVEPPSQPVDDFEFSSPSSSSSLSAESSGEECEEQFVQNQSNEAILQVTPEIPGPLVQNKRSKILHKMHEGKAELAFCGVKVTASFVKLPNGATFAWPRCTRCFRGEVLGSKRDLVSFIDQRARSSA